jgi:outer membrane immunogenic protein
MTKLAHVAVISLALAGSAMAADLRAPAYKAPGPAPVAYNWTGCYLGAGGGYGMWSQEVQGIDTNGFSTGTSTDNSGRGWFGTVQVGCDYQAGSNFVIGAFADYDFRGLKGDVAIAPIFAYYGHEKNKSAWAAGGRVGWLPFQQLLVFVSGGYTEADFDQVNVVSIIGVPNNQALRKHTYSGWFIGSGYEYGIGWLPGLFWKTEYRFSDYGTDRVFFFDMASGVDNLSIDSTKRIHTVRSELVWRFNFGGGRY